MEWSRDMAKALVRLYKEKDCLWNPQNQDHYQKSKRNDAWTEIAAELTVLYDNLVSINDCKKKMDCILSSFRREKIKVKRIRVEKGIHTKSAWFLFDSLSFLMDKGVHRLDPNSFATPVSHTPEITETFSMEPPPLRMSFQPEVEMTEENLDTDSQSRRLLALDEYSSFGMFVGNKLKNYSFYTRSAVQHAISDILFNADMGYYNRTATSVEAQTEIDETNSQQPHTASSQTQVQTEVQCKMEEINVIDTDPLLN